MAKEPAKYRQDVATLLHDLFCHYEHVEGCAWWYEYDRKNTWGEYAHKRYLDVADELLMRFSNSKNTMTLTLRWLYQWKCAGRL
jgi:hypothetical protein